MGTHHPTTCDDLRRTCVQPRRRMSLLGIAPAAPARETQAFRRARHAALTPTTLRQSRGLGAWRSLTAAAASLAACSGNAVVGAFALCEHVHCGGTPLPGECTLGKAGPGAGDHLRPAFASLIVGRAPVRLIGDDGGPPKADERRAGGSVGGPWGQARQRELATALGVNAPLGGSDELDVFGAERVGLNVRVLCERDVLPSQALLDHLIDCVAFLEPKIERPAA